MSKRKLHNGCFLLLFLFSCFVFQPIIEAFPYQSGWPKDFVGGISRSPVIADIDNDGFKEIIISVHDDVRIYILKANGDNYNGSWPKSIASNSGTAPTVADLDGDSDLEIIIGCGNLYAWHHTGEVVTGFPIIISDGYITTSPAIGDMTGDEIPEIAAGVSDCLFYLWDNQGNVLNGFPKDFLTKDGGCGILYTPAIGDIDLDGINEVVIQTQIKRIYAYNADGSIVSGIWDFEILPYGGPESDITMGDIDSDKIVEVLLVAHPVAGGGTWPIALNHDTSFVAGWPPVDLNKRTPGGLVMGDIDDDGKLEVVTGTQYSGGNLPEVYVFEGESGQIKNGWPVVLPVNHDFMRNMIIGDVNGDGSTDILGAAMSGWNDGKIYAWDVNGNTISGFPINISGYGPWNSTCFITDLDNDRDIEICVGVWDTYSSSKLIIWDLPYPYKGKLMPWPQDRHDPAHTNNYHWPNSPMPVPVVQPLGLLLIVTLMSLLIYLKTRGDRSQETGDSRW